MKAATTGTICTELRYIISIHAAREGGDHGGRSIVRDHSIISIHAAREGGDCKAPASETAKTISIHAAREGGDWGTIKYTLNQSKFQSTPPVKAATFSPHSYVRYASNFNPRRP